MTEQSPDQPSTAPTGDGAITTELADQPAPERIRRAYRRNATAQALPADPELAAMTVIAAALEPLADSARRRVLDYLRDRFNYQGWTKPAGAAPLTVTMSGGGAGTSTGPGAPGSVVISAGGNGGIPIHGSAAGSGGPTTGIPLHGAVPVSPAAASADQLADIDALANVIDSREPTGRPSDWLDAKSPRNPFEAL